MVILLLLLISPCFAIPSAPSVSAIGPNNATFTSTGASGNSWFLLGLYSGKEYLQTANLTPSAGTITKIYKDYPLGLSSTTYYVKACDSTGCSAETSFVNAVVTPLPISTRAAAFNNITESNFDIAFIPGDAINYYLNPFKPDLIDTGMALITAIVLMAILGGQFLRGRNTVTPTITFFLIGGLFMASGGLGLSISPEFLAVGQGFVYAALAGVIVSFFKKG